MAKRDLNTWTPIPAGKWISTFSGGLLIRKVGESEVRELGADEKFFTSENNYEFKYKHEQVSHLIGDTQYEDARNTIAKSGSNVEDLLSRVAALESSFSELNTEYERPAGAFEIDTSAIGGFVVQVAGSVSSPVALDFSTATPSVNTGGIINQISSSEFQLTKAGTFYGNVHLHVNQTGAGAYANLTLLAKINGTTIQTRTLDITDASNIDMSFFDLNFAVTQLMVDNNSVLSFDLFKKAGSGTLDCENETIDGFVTPAFIFQFYEFKGQGAAS
jgi:hypothetical protein